MSSATSPRPLAFTPVRRQPRSWTKKDLIEHVKTGMQVELGTLPIYFCALYSIKRDNGGWGSKARTSILSVAEQEMLHLALAGNLLRALDGTQPLYHRSFMPTYPSKILYDEVPMQLQPANKENLEYFVKIEAPYMPPPPPAVVQDALILADYHSIGEFYRSLGVGIEEVSQSDPTLFASNTEMQFVGAEFFDSDMTVVVDKPSALAALETIVDQGEGSIGVPNSHYSVFVELYQQRREWELVDYIDEPQTVKYQDNAVAYRLSLAVNAAYCYLLKTLDLCWQEADPAARKGIQRNIHRIMIEILSPTAHVLVTQQVGTAGKYAAPCFEFYPPDVDAEPLAAADLLAALRNELQLARDAAQQQGGDATADVIGMIVYSLDGLVIPGSTSRVKQ